MAQIYQNALRIVRRFGKSDYFMTFHLQIQSGLRFKENFSIIKKASDGPDLFARVFNLKLPRTLR